MFRFLETMEAGHGGQRLFSAAGSLRWRATSGSQRDRAFQAPEVRLRDHPQLRQDGEAAASSAGPCAQLILTGEMIDAAGADRRQPRRPQADLIAEAEAFLRTITANGPIAVASR